MKYTLLYIDDEIDNLDVFKTVFRHEYYVMTAESAKTALHILRQSPVHLIISDYRMPEMNGIDFFKEIQAEFPDINRVLLTAYNETDVLVRSINEAKIFGFVSKPWKKDELKAVIGSALDNYELTQRNKELVESLTVSNQQLKKANEEVKVLKGLLEAENAFLRREIEANHDISSIIGKSKSLKGVLGKIEQVAGITTTVLILGETGTGKELVARSIHKLSPRCDKPFVKLNCAALPSSLVESELFGHEKGAFTGALQNKIGMFEIADGGTIFLDEIGETPIDIQGKLLRVLQEGEFYKVGGSEPLSVDVRVIAATNRMLKREVDNGTFRADLFYRLNVFPIYVPPLRERTEDIRPLVGHFVLKLQKKLGIVIDCIPDNAYKILINHSWPGNIRELEAVIERAMILSSDGVLDLSARDAFDPGSWPKENVPLPPEIISLHEFEKQYITSVLAKVNWKISGKNGAAEILQLNHNTLRSKMHKLGIRFR